MDGFYGSFRPGLDQISEGFGVHGLPVHDHEILRYYQRIMRKIANFVQEVEADFDFLHQLRCQEAQIHMLQPQVLRPIPIQSDLVTNPDTLFFPHQQRHTEIMHPTNFPIDSGVIPGFERVPCHGESKTHNVQTTFEADCLPEHSTTPPLIRIIKREVPDFDHFPTAK